MDNRRNNGGKRSGAGRKPKADELELIEKLTPLDEIALKAIEQGVKSGSFILLNSSWSIALVNRFSR